VLPQGGPSAPVGASQPTAMPPVVPGTGVVDVPGTGPVTQGAAPDLAGVRSAARGMAAGTASLPAAGGTTGQATPGPTARPGRPRSGRPRRPGQSRSGRSR
jgi:hypothetical protein